MVKTAAETEAPPSSAWLSKGEKSIRAIVYEKIEPPPTGVKEVLLKFAGERYSGHGLKRMVSDEGRFAKGFWIFVFLCCFGLFGFGLFHVFCEFLQFRKITAMEVTYNEEVAFPAVTICNQNAINANKVEEYFGKTYTDPGDSYERTANKEIDLIWRLYRFDKGLAEEYRIMMNEANPNADTCTDVLDNIKCSVDQDFCENKQTSSATGVMMNVLEGSPDFDEFRAKLSFTKKQLTEFAFTYADLVTDCMFDGAPCSATQRHVWKHSKYGTCITINGDTAGDSEIITTTKYGEQHGLKLKLNANLRNYINVMAPAQGFRVDVHEPDSVPFPEEKGYDVPAGKLTKMPIITKYSDRLGKPFGKCGGGKPDENRGYGGGWLWGRSKDPYHMDEAYTSELTQDENDKSHYTEREWKHEGEYTESGCRRFYRNAIFEDKCKCTKVLERDQVESDLPDCDVTNNEMTNCIKGISTLDESRVNRMNCHVSCQETIYKPVIITGQLDEGPVPPLSTSEAKQVLNGEHCPGEAGPDNMLKTLGYKSTKKDDVMDMTEFVVYLQSPRVEKSSEYPKLTVQWLLFHIAGLLLMFLGSSVFIIPELLELVIDLLCTCCKKKEDQTTEDQYTSEEVMIEYPEINELSTNLDDICGGIFAIPEVSRKGPAPPVPEKRPKSTASIAYDIPAGDKRPKSTTSIAYDIPASDNRPKSTTSIAYDIPTADETEQRPKSTTSIAYDIPMNEDCDKRPKSTTSIAYDIPAEETPKVESIEEESVPVEDIQGFR